MRNVFDYIEKERGEKMQQLKFKIFANENEDYKVKFEAKNVSKELLLASVSYFLEEVSDEMKIRPENILDLLDDMYRKGESQMDSVSTLVEDPGYSRSPRQIYCDLEDQPDEEERK